MMLRLLTATLLLAIATPAAAAPAAAASPAAAAPDAPSDEVAGYIKGCEAKDGEACFNLAIAAMAIMLFTPEAVVGVSFQMSFSAVAALISGYAALDQVPPDLPRLAKPFRLAELARALGAL